jgi:hypothetical protein
MTCQDNSFIVGEFRNDIMVNGSKYIDANRNVYEPLSSDAGKFINGRLYGEGKISFINGDVYEGEFKDGKRCGHGKMQYKSVKKYHEFDDNISTSTGKDQDYDYATYEGKWNDN